MLGSDMAVPSSQGALTVNAIHLYQVLLNGSIRGGLGPAEGSRIGSYPGEADVWGLWDIDAEDAD